MEERNCSKVTKMKYVVSKKQKMTLTCEWEECVEAFENINDFLSHITEHLRTLATSGQNGTLACEWRNCHHKVNGGFMELMRHVYFHGFHIKLKNIGVVMMQRKKLHACMMSMDSCNVVPDLPERFQCGWKYCEVVSDNPYYFYEHVKEHSEEYPAGKNLKTKCKCHWEGCDALFKNRYKVLDHLRSHTQEKIVACPTCGSLFSSSTKFVDHLKRQENLDVQSFECSHCSKRYATERLLRDHMRKHVNNYKCPFCEMTTASPCTLKQHIKYRHSDERDFSCNHCSASFKTQRDRQRHIDTKHGDNAVFRCTHADCEFKTKHEFAINAHMKHKHRTEKIPVYVCDTCKKKYQRGQSLTIHLMKNHNLRWPPGHKKFWYKLASDGDFHLQTVRYESFALSQQLQTDRQNNTGRHGGKNESIVATHLEFTSQVGDTEEMSSSEEVLDLSSKSRYLTDKTNVASSSEMTNEFAFNLNMLGEVAVKEKQKSYVRNLCAEENAADLNNVSGPKRGRKSAARGRMKSTNKGVTKEVLGSPRKRKHISRKISPKVSANTKQCDNDSVDPLSPEETENRKSRKRPRKNESPTKLFVKLRKGDMSTDDEICEWSEHNNDNIVNSMPETVQFVTEDGQILLVETDVSNKDNDVSTCKMVDNSYNTATEDDAAVNQTSSEVVLNIPEENININEAGDVDGDCSYYTVVAGDSIIGLVSSKTGMYTPIPEGYTLNIQNNEGISGVPMQDSVIPQVNPQVDGATAANTASQSQYVEISYHEGMENEIGFKSEDDYDVIDLGVIVEEDENKQNL